MTNIHRLTATEARLSAAATERFGVPVNVYRDGGWLCEPRGSKTGLEIVMGAGTAEIAVDDFAEQNADLIEGFRTRRDAMRARLAGPVMSDAAERAHERRSLGG